MDKIPLLVELIGEPESGKTHFSLLFPNPMLIDMSAKGEGEVIAMKLYDNYKSRYVNVKSFGDVRKAIDTSKSDGRKTIIFDTSRYLVDLAGKEWCIEHKKDVIFPIMLYRFVYDKVDRLLSDIVKVPMNIVMTSGLRYEYKDNEKTGRREHDGYKKLPYQCDIRILLQLKSDGDKWIRTSRVAKNRFRDKAGEDYINSLKEISFDEIARLTGLPEEMIIK